MTLTDQQRAAAHAPGSVAVLAGAGSGKTHMLVARYLHHLETRSPLEVVAVTFTEAAAAELRARIRRGVQQARPGDLETLAELEAAQISTLHALCGRIIRDHPDAAGVRPDAAVMDEGQTRLWQARQFRAVLGKLPTRLYRHLPFSRMAGALQALLADPLLAEQALTVGQDRWEAWAVDARTAALHALRSRPEWQAAREDLRRVQGDPADRMEQARAQAVAAMDALNGTEDWSDAVQALLSIKLVGGSAKLWPAGGLSVTKEALKAVRELVTEASESGLLTLTPGESDEWLALVLPDLREAFHLTRAALTDLKRRAGLLDFNDLEVHALQALQSESVQAHYAQRWTAFLIDEAQDNNPVQAAILDLLSQGRTRTLVGDIKQSIYGFRRAAPDLFRETSEAITRSGGQAVALDQSFRTHQALVGLANTVFQHLLGDLHAPLTAARPGPGLPEALSLEAWQVTELKPKARARLAEGLLITRRVQDLLGVLPVHDPATGTDRPLRPGDVAVLTRGWAALGPIRRALSTAGLPVQDLTTGSLLSTQEAQDALALLTAAALQDPAALVTVLRSPFALTADPVIHRLGQTARDQDGNWFTALQNSDDAALSQARHLISELQRRQRFTRPSELLALADRLSGYTAVIANLWDGERRLADWQGFLTVIRELERGEDDTFSVVRELRARLDEEVSVPRPVLEDRDAITLTTMHSSKGLEWPVVIIADLNWSAPPGAPEVVMDAEYGAALRGPYQLAPMAHTLIHARRQAREEAETRRLLYVAITRARDHVILTANGPGKKGSLLHLLEPALASAGLQVTVRDAPPLPDGPPDLPPLQAAPAPASSQPDPVRLTDPAPQPAPGLNSPDPVEAPLPHPDDWSELYDLLDPAWVEWARALAAAGVPAPSDVHVDLPVQGRVSGQSALMLWARPGRDVILTETPAPVSSLTVHLDDDPNDVARRLQPLLSGSA